MTSCRPDFADFWRFLLVGGAGALLYVGLSTALLHLAQYPASVVSIGVHAGLIPLMFMCQRTFTFRSQGPAIVEFAKYALLQIGSISTSTAMLVHFANEDWHINAIVFTAIAMTASLLSYVVCRFAIFARCNAALRTRPEETT